MRSICIALLLQTALPLRLPPSATASRRAVLTSVAATPALFCLRSVPAAAATPPAATATPTASTEFISGLVAGGAQKTIKELVLHPLDTIKCRLQIKSSRRSLVDKALYDGLYDGLAPALISGAPAASVFFAVKDAVKQQVKPAGLGKIPETVIAVAGANVPYWLLRNPTEVIKARRQAGQLTERTGEAVASLWEEKGLGGFYRGYASNYAYAFPVDATKFVIYGSVKEYVKQRNGGQKLTPLEAAVGGALASSAAQTISTPFDVARTRVMTAPSDEAVASFLPTIATVAREEGVGALYAGVVPKIARAVVSGGLQFSVLEGVKDAVDALLGVRR